MKQKRFDTPPSSWRGNPATSLLLGLVLFWCGPAPATEVYTWTDANGVVHYSDSPPASGASATVQVDEIYRPGSADAYPSTGKQSQLPAAAPDQPESPPPPTAAQLRREQIAENRSKSQEARAETERLCALHRQRLEQMEPSRRVFYTDEQGETVRMDDEQRVSLVEESKAFVARNCGG